MLWCIKNTKSHSVILTYLNPPRNGHEIWAPKKNTKKNQTIFWGINLGTLKNLTASKRRVRRRSPGRRNRYGKSIPWRHRDVKVGKISPKPSHLQVNQPTNQPVFFYIDSTKFKSSQNSDQFPQVVFLTKWCFMFGVWYVDSNLFLYGVV